MLVKYKCCGEEREVEYLPAIAADKLSACLGVLWKEGFNGPQLDEHLNNMERCGSCVYLDYDEVGNLKEFDIRLMSFELTDMEKRGVMVPAKVITNRDSSAEYTSQLTRNKKKYDILYT